MKTLLIMAALLLPFTVLADEDGNENGNGCRNRCGDTTVNNGDTINKGGKANAEAEAHAYAKANASAFGYVKGGDQYQKAYQSLYASFRNSNSQSQLGVVANVGPQVVITDKSVTTYEAQERDPVASAYSRAEHRYECVVGVGAGVQAPSLGISLSGGYESTLCNLGYVAKFLPTTDARYGKLVGAMYDIAMDAAGFGPDTSTKRDPDVRYGR